MSITNSIGKNGNNSTSEKGVKLLKSGRRSQVIGSFVDVDDEPWETVDPVEAEGHLQRQIAAHLPPPFQRQSA